MRTVVGPLAQSLVQTSLSHWTRQRFMEKFLNFIIRQKSGNIMMKRFFTNCRTILFGNSSGRNNVVSISTGTIDQTDFVEPVMNVFIDSKIRLTPIDSNFP